jgi:hypothetical protein
MHESNYCKNKTEICSCSPYPRETWVFHVNTRLYVWISGHMTAFVHYYWRLQQSRCMLPGYYMGCVVHLQDYSYMNTIFGLNSHFTCLVNSTNKVKPLVEMFSVWHQILLVSWRTRPGHYMGCVMRLTVL